MSKIFSARIGAALCALALFAGAAPLAAATRGTVEGSLILQGRDVLLSASNASRLVIAECGACERLVLKLSGETRFALDGAASSWSELSGLLQANPAATLQVRYRARSLVATQLSVSLN